MININKMEIKENIAHCGQERFFFVRDADSKTYVKAQALVFD